MRLLIVDDHPSTATGLAAVLGRETDIEVVGVAGDVEEALQLVAELAPSMLLCDVQLQGEPGGFEILRRVRDLPGRPAVVLFSSFDYPAFHQRALELGAAGRGRTRLQRVQIAERADLVSRSRGREPYQRVRLYLDEVRGWRRSARRRGGGGHRDD